MKKSLLLLALVAGCGGGAQEGNDHASNSTAPTAQREAGEAPAASSSSIALTGLYESGSGDQKNQLCMVEKGSATQFGLIVSGANMHSCAGAGTAVRTGNRLTLTMTGDTSCTIPARFDGGKIILPGTLPEGCSYYCGARASMANVQFNRTGTTAADAAKAKDLADDPLC